MGIGCEIHHRKETSQKGLIMKERLEFYKMHKEVNIPQFSTEGSACFDIEYNPHGLDRVDYFRFSGVREERLLGPFGELKIMPGDRVICPTGLIMNIPEGYSVRLHPRSSVGIKMGLMLANCEAVIDWDYVDELFIAVYNTSFSKLELRAGTRIAQGELIKSLEYDIVTTRRKPVKKTDREGGLGSTGE